MRPLARARRVDLFVARARASRRASRPTAASPSLPPPRRPAAGARARRGAASALTPSAPRAARAAARRCSRGGRATAAERQRTLRATIEWSYELLEEEEQRLLRGTVACSRGGWTVEAAEAVCERRCRRHRVARRQEPPPRLGPGALRDARDDPRVRRGAARRGAGREPRLLDELAGTRSSARRHGKSGAAHGAAIVTTSNGHVAWRARGRPTSLARVASRWTSGRDELEAATLGRSAGCQAARTSTTRARGPIPDALAIAIARGWRRWTAASHLRPACHRLCTTSPRRTAHHLDIAEARGLDRRGASRSNAATASAALEGTTGRYSGVPASDARGSGLDAARAASSWPRDAAQPALRARSALASRTDQPSARARPRRSPLRSRSARSASRSATRPLGRSMYALAKLELAQGAVPPSLAEYRRLCTRTDCY